MTIQARIAALKLAAIVTWGFGLVTWLAIVWGPAHAFGELFFDVAIWPVLDGAQRLEGEVTNMLLAIVAGFTLAIGTFVWLVATYVMPRDEALGRRMVAWPMGLWFVIDSLGSWAGGAGGNVLLNIGFAVLFLAPVLWPGSEGERAVA